LLNGQTRTAGRILIDITDYKAHLQACVIVAKCSMYCQVYGEKALVCSVAVSEASQCRTHETLLDALCAQPCIPKFSALNSWFGFNKKNCMGKNYIYTLHFQQGYLKYSEFLLTFKTFYTKRYCKKIEIFIL
jgi:hypothetical protein